MNLNPSLSWKSMLVGGLIVSLTSKVLMYYAVVFAFTKVLGDMILLVGLVGGGLSLFKRKR